MNEIKLKELQEQGFNFTVHNNGYHVKFGKHINYYPTTGRVFNNITKESFLCDSTEALSNYIREHKREY